MTPLHALAAIAGTLALALPAPVRAEAPDPAPQQPFAATSVWNQSVPAGAPVAADSTAQIAELMRMVATSGAWINSTQWSAPVYQVAVDQPKLRVRLDTPSSMYTNDADAADLAEQLAAVPIPLAARPAPGTDHHLVIWQPSTDTMWELWLARHVQTLSGPKWHAAWGSRIDGLSASDGINRYPFGASASGLPFVGGMMTRDQVDGRSISHALSLAIPETAARRWVWPANRTDGNTKSPVAIAEGAHLRLDPSVDVDKLDLPPVTRAMAVAAQRYGIIVRDRADAVTFYAEDTGPFGAPADWGGLTPGELLAQFPWDRLQVLEPTHSATRASARCAKLRRARRARCARR